jgi:predicted permease
MLSFLFQALARIRAALHPGRLDQDLDAEIESHLSLRTEHHMRRGLPFEEAQRLAKVEFGGLTQLHEAHRATRALPFLDTLVQDLRYALRMLRHNPGFTIFAVLIIGLGIGAASTVFSIVNAILIRPLPFTDAKRLVWMYNLADDGVSQWGTQVGHFLDLQKQNTSFSGLTAYFTSFEPGDTKLSEGGATYSLSGVAVAQNFFSFLGVQPLVGRSFTPEECRWNAPGTAVLSYAFWNQHYASDPAVVGRTITLNNAPVTVVGLAPASFDFATVFAPGNRIDVYRPMPLTVETNHWGNTLDVIARLRPGVTLKDAQSQVRLVANRLQREHPERNTLRPVLLSLDQHVTGHVRPGIITLGWSVVIVMIIVCANIANLQIARGLSRQNEIAIRAAVGAGRPRLIRQMLTESVVLSSCGAGVGLLVAFVAVRLIASLHTAKVALLATVRMDVASLVFSLALALISGLLFGLAPALQVPLASVHNRLKDISRTASASKRHLWVRSTLVISEIVFACVLLTGTGLLVRSFINVLNLNPGFQPEHAAALRIEDDSNDGNRQQRDVFFDRVLERVRTMPGIRAAGLSDMLPLVGDRSWDITARGRLYERGHYPEGFIRFVSSGYFEAMGIPFRAGHGFTERDTPASEPVAVVNETTARTLWPGQNPLGQILIAEGPRRPGRRVVGLVADVRHRSLEQGSGCEVYMPLRQTDDTHQFYLVVRTNLSTAALASGLRTAFRPIAPRLSTNELRTLQDVVDTSVSPRRFVVSILSGFTIFAVILAALGIYAVISYSVNQRRTEMGIRMALGASARELQRRVLLQGLRLAAIGLLIGGAAAWFSSRVLESLLFGVRTTDPTTFLGTALILTVVAGSAAYLPTLYISRIEPQAALRVS